MSSYEEAPIFNPVQDSCPSCGAEGLEYTLERTLVPYGEAEDPNRVRIECHVIYMNCKKCDESFADWQHDALVTAAIELYKESKT